jgi:hypothetical protein
MGEKKVIYTQCKNKRLQYQQKSSLLIPTSLPDITRWDPANKDCSAKMNRSSLAAFAFAGIILVGCERKTPIQNSTPITDKELLNKASDIAFKKLAGADYRMESVEEPHKTVVIVYSAQGVIDNGGMAYFFENDWPNNPPYSVFADAYERIGRADAAKALRDAVKSFGVPNPENNCKARREYMEAHQGRFNGMVWDDCICGDEKVFECLAQWVRSHPDHNQ